MYKLSLVITTKIAARKYRKTYDSSIAIGCYPASICNVYTYKSTDTRMSVCAHILQKHACPGSREAKVNEHLLSSFWHKTKPIVPRNFPISDQILLRFKKRCEIVTHDLCLEIFDTSVIYLTNQRLIISWIIGNLYVWIFLGFKSIKIVQKTSLRGFYTFDNVLQRNLIQYCFYDRNNVVPLMELPKADWSIALHLRAGETTLLPNLATMVVTQTAVEIYSISEVARWSTLNKKMMFSRFVPQFEKKRDEKKQ